MQGAAIGSGTEDFSKERGKKRNWVERKWAEGLRGRNK